MAKEETKEVVKYELKYPIFMQGQLFQGGFFAKDDIDPEFYKHFYGLEKEAKEIQEKLDKDKWEAKGRLVGIEIDKRKNLDDIIKEVKKATVQAKVEAGLI